MGGASEAETSCGCGGTAAMVARRRLHRCVFRDLMLHPPSARPPIVGLGNNDALGLVKEEWEHDIPRPWLSLHGPKGNTFEFQDPALAWSVSS